MPLTAETVGTYWGRRTRLYVQGDIDVTTGKFSKIKNAEGIVSNFDVSINNNQVGLYAEIATVKGTNGSGFKFNSYQYDCNDTCASNDNVDLATIPDTNKGTYCIKENSKDCENNTGIVMGSTAEDFAFLKIGAAFDDQEGSRSAMESWIVNAGIPTFTKVDKSKVLK